ncbi:MAG TPA: hypothetical protein VGI39_36480, partial [Polyangiaceae bacterium]
GVMRRVSALAFVCLAGCITNSNGSESDDAGITIPGYDAGPTPVIDSSTPPHDATAPVDATNPADVSIPDTSTPPADVQPDTTPAPVSMTVLDPASQLPVAGIPIVFSDATGAVLASATTTANGTATNVMPAGGMVTVVLGTTTNPQLVTIVGVEPGDSLTALNLGSTPISQLDILGFPAGPPPQASNFEFFAGACGSQAPSPPLLFEVDPACQLRGQTSIVVQPLDANGAPLAQFAVAKGIPLLDAGIDEAGGVPFSFGDAGYTNLATTEILFANGVPSTGFTSDANGYLILTELIGGLPLQNSTSFVLSQVDASTSNPFTAHGNVAEAVQGEAQITDYTNGGTARTAIASRGPAPADGGAAALDMSQLLPVFGGVATVDSTDATRPILSWGSDAGAPAGIDGAYAGVGWYGTGQNGTWLFVVPPTATSVKAPALPDTLSAYGPNVEAGTPYFPLTGAAYVEGTFIANYAQLRATFASLPTPLVNGNQATNVVPPLPVDGTMRITAVTYNGD